MSIVTTRIELSRIAAPFQMEGLSTPMIEVALDMVLDSKNGGAGIRRSITIVAGSAHVSAKHRHRLADLLGVDATTWYAASDMRHALDQKDKVVASIVAMVQTAGPAKTIAA